MNNEPVKTPVGLSLRRIVGLSSIYGITPIIDKFMSLLLLPVFARYLKTDGYGSMILLYTAASLLGLIVFMGLPDSLQKLYWDYEGKARRDFFGTIWIANLAVAAVLIVPLILLAGPVSALLLKNDKVSFLFVLNCVRLLLLTQTIIPFVFFRSQEQKGKILAVNLISIFVRIGLTALLVIGLKMGLLGVFLADIGATLATLFIYLPGLKREINLTFKWQYIKEAMTLSPFQLVVELLAWIVSLSDRILIQQLLRNVAEVGIYSLGYTIGSAALFMVNPFMAAWKPYVYSVHSENREEYSRQMGQFFMYFYMICCGSFLVIAAFSPELIMLMTTQTFYAAIRVVPIILLAQILAIVSNYFVSTFFIAKRMYPVIITYAVAAVANIGGNFLLIPRMGITGAAWSTLIAYAIMAVMLGAFSQRTIPIRLPYRFMLAATAATAAVWFLVINIHAPSIASSLASKAAVVGVALLSAGWWAYAHRKAWGKPAVYKT